jgi:hypothetical protein
MQQAHVQTDGQTKHIGVSVATILVLEIRMIGSYAWLQLPSQKC